MPINKGIAWGRRCVGTFTQPSPNHHASPSGNRYADARGDCLFAEKSYHFSKSRTTFPKAVPLPGKSYDFSTAEQWMSASEQWMTVAEHQLEKNAHRLTLALGLSPCDSLVGTSRAPPTNTNLFIINYLDGNYKRKKQIFCDGSVMVQK